MADGSLHIDFQQSGNVVFDKRMVRRAFIGIGQEHLSVARRLIASRNRSQPGQNPGSESGQLSGSIGFYVPNATSRRPGFMVRIAPNQKRGRGKTASITGDYYPAFLMHGVKRGARRQRRHNRGASGGSGWRIAPRNNFMNESLEHLAPWTRYVLAQALRRALITEGS